MTTTLQGEADQMLAAASVDARRVLDSDLVGRAKAAGDPTATAVALRAMGLAAANLDRVDDAVVLLEQAAAIGDLPSQVRLGVLNTYGVVLAWAGNLEEGELILNRVVRAAVGPVRAQALVQRGAIRFRRSNYRGAIADFDRAEALLDRRSLGSTWANLFTNKGLTLVMIGKPRDALRILERATASWVKAGSPMAAATSHHNLGWAAGRLGDIPLALGHFDRAEEEMLQLGGPVGELWRDRADVLAAAGLTADAIATAQKAVAELGKGGHHAAQAEALVRLAETALGGAETALAIESADRAATLFRRQRRSGWAAHSELVG
ncbi:MAG: tetratricopeptide repeat protein, partial [Actinomycetota bacterium]